MVCCAALSVPQVLCLISYGCELDEHFVVFRYPKGVDGGYSALAWIAHLIPTPQPVIVDHGVRPRELGTLVMS
jgi:hypothetical protein